LLRGDGKKFGKSEGGNENVWLDAKMTSPFAFYQHLLNIDDASTPEALRYFTFLGPDEILDLDEATKNKPQERLAQRALAREVVTLVHGSDAAAKAESASEAIFSAAISELDEATLLEVVRETPSSMWSREQFRNGMDPTDLFVRCELAKSKGEARRFLEQGGFYVNNQRVAPEDVVSDAAALHGRYLVLRRGRRELHLVVLA
jgi:tyrosyl-tRNA synthetase